MKKLYFAMVPERSALEDLLVAVGVGAGVLLGAKYLLGGKKWGEALRRVRDTVLPRGESAARKTAQGPDTGRGIHDADGRAWEEDEILSRIRAAAEKQGG